jgi:hypothetical protein
MIRTLVAPTALVAAVILSTAAFAAVQTKTGEIKSTDAAKHELVLSSGETFELGSTIKIDKLKAGEKVTVTYDMKDGKMVASKVHLEK